MICYLTIKCRHCGKAVNEPSRWRRDTPCAACNQPAGWDIALIQTTVTADSAEAPSPGEALRQVWYQLTAHSLPGHSPVDTLNRLLTKHFNARFPNIDLITPPTLHSQDLRAPLEWWSTPKLTSLWLAHQRDMPGGPGAPEGFINLPVIVLRLDALDCLIDGNTRINKRIADSVPEPHPVYFLEVG